MVVLVLFASRALAEGNGVPQESADVEETTPVAQTEIPAGTKDSTDRVSHRWAVIIVGLPGDAEHDKLFRKTAEIWKNWLIDSLEFPRDQVIRLPELADQEVEESPPVTADQIRSRLAELREKLQADDSLWVFTLGHGSHDGKRAWLHLAGRDPSDVDFANWFAGFRCQEQVLWLTHSCSGWMVKPLSRPGRIVIAATAADDEANETEFPHALATLVRTPPKVLDIDGDGQLTVAELYDAVVAEVTRRFKRDKRLETEHAQLDDNGDAKGTENLKEKPAVGVAKEFRPGDTLVVEAIPKVDGLVAAKTVVPDRRLMKTPTVPEPVETPAIESEPAAEQPVDPQSADPKLCRETSH
ncbi:MAG: hypothetical protein NT069_16300 [Planctomycetota bacterium]|nr:hypothetical protein [Planctomycetota bacterium]